MKITDFQKLFLFILLLALAACGGEGGTAEPRVDATITLTAWDGGSYYTHTAIYLLVHDENGRLLSTQSIEPDEEPRDFTLEQVPLSGSITVASVLTYSTTYPREGEYEQLSAVTFPVKATQENPPLPTIHVDWRPYFESQWGNDGQFHVTGPCPEGAGGLIAPSTQYGSAWISQADCSGTPPEANGTLYVPKQEDGGLSAVLWAVDDYFGYLVPPTYIALWDVPDFAEVELTASDYRHEVEAWSLVVEGAPANAYLTYGPSGVRKGAEVAGSFALMNNQPCEAAAGALCSQIYAADVQDHLDGYLLAATIGREAEGDAFSYTVRWEPEASPAKDTVWSYDGFYPLFTELQLGYEPFTIQVGGGPDAAYQYVGLRRYRFDQSPYQTIMWEIYQYDSQDTVTLPALPASLARFRPEPDDANAFTTLRRVRDNPIRGLDRENGLYVGVNKTENFTRSLERGAAGPQEAKGFFYLRPRP